ncbi:MAG: hypothetical protein R3F41_11450 [Gammaproteobacteria bacterium]|nr:hypothetical protein [Pseudomonadales bacterium]MCP5348226.1 hypothetical protein [Pseudomonadales bacterium]
MFKQLVASASIFTLLAACQSGTEPNINEDFGNAVRQNVAIQTLNPDAGGSDDSASLDGPRAEQAVDRMRNRSNQVQNASLIQGVAN